MPVASKSSETSPALPRGFLHAGEAPAGRVYLRPLDACGTGRAPGRVEVLCRLPEGGRAVPVSLADLRAWAEAEGPALAAHVAGILECLSRPLAPFSGLAMDRPRIMGIVNVTPDSFSDGGEAYEVQAAVARGRELAAAGADILDVGGESTRPGAAPVAPGEEMRRVLPVIRVLAAEGYRVSVDTRRAVVMEAALEAGAAIVNDVTALADDPDSLPLVARHGVPAVLMHMRGEPGTMQRDPRYGDALLDIYDFLSARVAACVAAGVAQANLCVDPGIGFGKTAAHNLRLIAGLGLFRGLGCPVLLGVSRKRMIGEIAGISDPKARVPGSLALGLAGVARGAGILRVHDVAETRQALALWSAVEKA